jgi:hypothetical protein
MPKKFDAIEIFALDTEDIFTSEKNDNKINPIRDFIDKAEQQNIPVFLTTTENKIEIITNALNKALPFKNHHKSDFFYRERESIELT